MVVTWNISAPSQSVVVITGVWDIHKAVLLEELVDAVGAAERMRKAALNRLVRARRWGMVRKNSTVWRFFCRG